MMMYKKILIICWLIVFVFALGFAYWIIPKTDTGIITQKIAKVEDDITFVITLDGLRNYQFPNRQDWSKAHEQEQIKITYQGVRIDLFNICVPHIQSFEILKKPPQ